MPRNRYPIIASEGVPLLLLNGALIILAFHFVGWLAVVLLLFLLLALVLLFRDPVREIPADPQAVLAPCDGVVTRIEPTDKGVLEREALRIVIRVDNFGAYTARSPVEGRVFDPRDNVQAGSRLLGINGLWVRTDADDDVITLFRGPKHIGAPQGFIRYGERVGQGQRCAYLRLAREANVLLPSDVRIGVSEGERVEAGVTPLAKFRYE